MKRLTVERISISATPEQKCDWCDQHKKTLYAYGNWKIKGQNGEIRLAVFCNKKCARGFYPSLKNDYIVWRGGH